MFENDGYALIIGVDDYSAYDASTGKPQGRSDLRGSRNDARAFYRLCRSLGMKPERIRVLASPPLDPAELEGAIPENVGPATEASILAGVAWLAESLAQPARPAGLLTYSGHGDAREGEGLVICPSDVRGEALDHAVSFGAINAILERYGAAENLTVVLDTCHGRGSLAGRGAALSLGQGGVEERSVDLAGRVLAACARGGVAFQSKFDGQYRGVFSWAITTAMEQWAVTQEGTSVRLDVSYGKLVETARRLVAGLWFEQTPELRAPASVEKLAVFRRGLVGHPGETSERPTGAFLTAQLDGGYFVYRKVTLTFASGTPLATVYVFNQAIGSFNTGTEYWYVNLGATNLIGTSSLSIAYTDSSSTTPPPDPNYASEQRFTEAQNVSWGSAWTTDPLSYGTLHAGPNNMWLRLAKSSTSPHALTNIAWYQALPTGRAPANISPSGTFNVVGSLTLPGGYSGFDINQRA
jgi:hypothetical protein